MSKDEVKRFSDGEVYFWIEQGETIHLKASSSGDLLMKAQMQAVLNQVQQLLGNRFIRVDDSAQTDGLDDVRAIPMLICKGSEIGEANYSVITSRFINGVEAAEWRELIQSNSQAGGKT